MTELVRIRTDVTTYECQPGRNVIGVVAMVGPFGGFPAMRWSDFLIPIVGWWSQEVLNVIDGSAASASFHFMDGPYYAEAVFDGDVGSATFWRRYADDEEVRYTGVYSLLILAQDLVEVANMVLEFAATEGASEIEQTRLTTHRDRLQKWLSAQDA